LPIPTVRPSRDDMLKCVARFKDLRGVSEGLPDMQLEGCHRTFYSVLGFSQPKGKDEFSPFGDAVRPKISHLQPGFGIAFVAARPNQGVLMHNHDTNETFMVVEGRWKLEWEGEHGNEHVVLEPKDFISFPVGVQRRFECLQAPDGKDEGLLLGIIQGEAPVAEISPEGMKRLYDAGILKPETA
jgi:mannose-6-phosphate isomerase-like protein (cupin superfamily)